MTQIVAIAPEGPYRPQFCAIPPYYLTLCLVCHIHFRELYNLASFRTYFLFLISLYKSMLSLVLGTGIATYTGIELARDLRRINSKIPIYILTNYADEFVDGEWSVEDIAKGSFRDDKQNEITSSRIIRRIDVYKIFWGGGRSS